MHPCVCARAHVLTPSQVVCVRVCVSLLHRRCCMCVSVHVFCVFTPFQVVCVCVSLHHRSCCVCVCVCVLCALIPLQVLCVCVYVSLLLSQVLCVCPYSITGVCVSLLCPKWLCVCVCSYPIQGVAPNLCMISLNPPVWLIPFYRKGPWNTASPRSKSWGLNPGLPNSRALTHWITKHSSGNLKKLRIIMYL